MFAQFHETLIPLLYLPTSMGPLSLADWLGGQTIGAVVLFFAFGVFVFVIGKIWGRSVRGN